MHIPDFHHEGYSQVSPRSITPLHVTAFVGLSVIGQDLIEQGICINALNQYMDTSLQIATLAGHVDMVRVLLEHGADLFVHGQSAGTPLQRSAARNYLDICELLLARDAGKIRSYSTESTNSFNAREWDGSPLILATDQGHLKICPVLLLKCAEVLTHFLWKNIFAHGSCKWQSGTCPASAFISCKLAGSIRLRSYGSSTCGRKRPSQRMPDSSCRRM